MIYRLNQTPIKISAFFPLEIDAMFINIMWKSKELKEELGQSERRMKRKILVTLNLTINLQYKIVWCLLKDRQDNRHQNPC